jgi:hypothetical protein
LSVRVLDDFLSLAFYFLVNAVFEVGFFVAVRENSLVSSVGEKYFLCGVGVVNFQLPVRETVYLLFS